MPSPPRTRTGSTAPTWVPLPTPTSAASRGVAAREGSYAATIQADFLGIRLAKVGSPSQLSEADTDADGIPDVLDKCLLDSRNAVSTCDTDGDGYGNVCDGDFNQSGVTNTIDGEPQTVLRPLSQGAERRGRRHGLHWHGRFRRQLELLR